MILTAMVAMTEERVIGVDNTLPWHLPADLRRFKQLTLGKPIIMGRKTHEAIGRILPGRLNIIVSRNQHLVADPMVRVVHTPHAAVAAVQDVEEACLIGGAQLYQALLPYVHRIYMTIVHAHISGDAYFPELNLAHWRTQSRIDHGADSQHLYPYSFITLERC